MKRRACARAATRSRATSLGQPRILRRERASIGVGKITVIVRVLFRPHFVGDTRLVVPIGAWIEPIFRHASLPQSGRGDFVFQRATHAGKAVHVFDLIFRSEFFVPTGRTLTFTVAAHHAFSMSQSLTPP